MQPFTLPSKYPAEIVKGLYVDFKNRFVSGETVASCTVTTVPAGMATNVQYLGTVVSWDTSGGNARDKITFTISATGTEGSKRIAQATMSVVAQS